LIPLLACEFVIKPACISFLSGLDLEGVDFKIVSIDNRYLKIIANWKISVVCCRLLEFGGKIIKSAKHDKIAKMWSTLVVFLYRIV
jgi:hypothetical protein